MKDQVNKNTISQMISAARRFSPYKVYTASNPVVKVQVVEVQREESKNGKKKLS